MTQAEVKGEIHIMERKDTLEGTMSGHRRKGVIRNGGGGVPGHQRDHLCGGRREETMGELLVDLLVEGSRFKPDCVFLAK